MRHEHVAERRPPRPALVGHDERPRAHVTRAPSKAAAGRDARCMEAFVAFAIVALVFSALGIARVALAARAAALSIESGQIREQIKSERFEGDMLEIQQSALAAPPRIGTIAAATLSMESAKDACYITIDGATVCSGDADKVTKAGDSTARKDTRVASAATSRGLLSSVMHTAAGEAQALLLGDVGLASSR